MELFIYILGDQHKHARPPLHHHIPASQPQHHIVLASDSRVPFSRHILALHSQHNWLSTSRHKPAVEQIGLADYSRHFGE